jgi:hypothetical protein
VALAITAPSTPPSRAQATCTTWEEASRLYAQNSALSRTIDELRTEIGRLRSELLVSRSDTEGLRGTFADLEARYLQLQTSPLKPLAKAREVLLRSTVAALIAGTTFDAESSA